MPCDHAGGQDATRAKDEAAQPLRVAFKRDTDCCAYDRPTSAGVVVGHDRLTAERSALTGFLVS